MIADSSSISPAVHRPDGVGQAEIVSSLNDLVIIVPTYNERENLPQLLESLMTLAQGIRVVIVDDNSPDGTGAVADALAAIHPKRIEVLHRSGKQGLGTAYVVGFQHVLSGSAKLIATMDADLSHPVDRLPAMVERASDADLVLGSRYVGGGATVGWPLPRRVLSRFGGLYARTILGLPLNDLTGGFKVYRREALAGLDLDHLRADGYGFQIETTWRVIQNGGRVVEVPITFTDRVAGASKLSRHIVLEAALLVWQLRLDRLRSR
ncbi:MAG: Dolichol-phosphate mannosyltransferase in lipid-linked oligosaccharide synthesis cluster [uncultured Thermomicrobiales bacterium]|uniref:Dolichol-phosphate mannosyltransferase in lipid-linked oligosaccharide synthesis cluster n=1 Tax=uncultured Thermomicrobiales bacterium TaxID=1645740 RepID=A0A6J4UHS9_9BACT|nr:MAG: Dolichol-phosphate mannosyltransferase in lipid-linked oligosaccharide synthesis cluster [uncultured Thermomicrobiales bacterium]